MRRGIGLRGYGGIDPLNEFKREAFKLYEELRGFIRKQVANTIFRVSVQSEPETVPLPGGGRGQAAATKRRPDRVAKEVGMRMACSRVQGSECSAGFPSDVGKPRSFSPGPAAGPDPLRDARGVATSHGTSGVETPAPQRRLRWATPGSRHPGARGGEPRRLPRSGPRGARPALDRRLPVDSLLNSVNDKRRTLALLEAGRIRHTSLAFEIEHMACHGEVVVVMARDR